MFPDALNYFSFAIALLCATPLVIGLSHYIGYVISVFYHCNDTVSRIEANLKAIEDMDHDEEKASRSPPPHLYDRIRACKVDFDDLRGRSESIRIWQSPLQLASAIYHILRADAAVCRLLRVEEALGTLLDQWKDKSDIAVMMNNGGHLAKPSGAAAEVETGIQSPSPPVLEVPKTVSATVSMDTPSRLSPQIEQPVQRSEVDNDSDFESSSGSLDSGSEAGATSAHESQVDTDGEILQPLPMTPPRVRSFGSRRPLRRKRSTLSAQDPAVEDDRAYLTMYASNTTLSACHGEGSCPPGALQLRRSHAGKIHSRPSVITEGIARPRLEDCCEGDITPTALHDDIAVQPYDSTIPNTTPTTLRMPTPYTPPLPPASPVRIARRSGC